MPINHYRDLPPHLMDAWNRRPNPNPNDYIQNDGPRYWWVYDADGSEITHWECRPFPGCATLVVTTHIELRPALRGRGLGTYFHELRRRAYAAAGFRGEVCTVRNDADAQNHIVAHGGQCMGTFPSDLGGTYGLWLLPLPEAPRVLPGIPTIPLNPRPNVPAPTVDTCGQVLRYPQGEGNCTRPLGHLGAHGPNPYIGSAFRPEEFGVTPAPPPRKPKLFAHRKPNVL